MIRLSIATVSPQRQRRFASAIALWHRNHVTRAALRRLDRVALTDLGLGPDKARQEASKWFWQS